ncbi:MAG: DUF58 domain-containing protein [Planctomycetes bacterium]|nr:DUF58 domain-containing protein [Planctomycetota bacterium]
MLRPTRRTLLLLGLGAPLAAAPAIGDPSLWPLWVGYVGALLSAVGADLVLAARRRELRVDVRAPATLALGAGGQLVVGVAGPAGLRAVEIAPGLTGTTPSPEPATVPLRGGEVRVAFPLQPARRGPTTVTSVWLRWTGPLGLLWNEHAETVGARIDVLPDTRPLREAALRLRARPEQRTGARIEHYLGDGSEFDSLREYVAGFDRRAIDWKASARHRELLCRQYRAERNHQVILAVDTGARMGEALDGVPRLDHAIRLALRLAFTCLSAGDLVGAFAFDDQPRAHEKPMAGLGALARLQAAFAALDYSTAETNYTLALTQLLAETRRRSLVVLFTDFADSITAELMLPNVVHLARRHLLLFVALRDPLLAGATSLAPRSLRDVHRAVVAGDLARDREIVLERIRRAGGHVVDAAPAEVGTALVNRYLELKRREAV